MPIALSCSRGPTSPKRFRWSTAEGISGGAGETIGERGVKLRQLDETPTVPTRPSTRRCGNGIARTARRCSGHRGGATISMNATRPCPDARHGSARHPRPWHWAGRVSGRGRGAARRLSGAGSRPSAPVRRGPRPSPHTIDAIDVAEALKTLDQGGLRRSPRRSRAARRQRWCSCCSCSRLSPRRDLSACGWWR